MHINNRQLPLASTSIHSKSTFDNPRLQHFSLRQPFMKYILENSTGKVWKKLIKTCKYFFPKYHAYPLKSLSVANSNTLEWKADGENVYRTKFIPKLWLFGNFYSYGSLAASKFISKIVKCDLRELHIYEYPLTWEIYQKLTSSGYLKKLYLNKCSIKYVDGEDVKMDSLLDNLYHVEKFIFICKPGSKLFKKDTLKKLAKILSGYKHMRHFYLSHLDESFGLYSFMDFLTKNEIIMVHLHFAFDLHPSTAYKEMLETCFEQLVVNRPKQAPKIFISGFRGPQYQRYF